MKKIKDLLYPLRHTPFHPQWLIYRSERAIDEWIKDDARGIVVDIGCADQSLKKKLSSDCEYIGLDFPGTVDSMYKTRPTVFGDAHQPPFATSSVDTVTLLQVLEHLSDPETALLESCNLLKTNGLLILSMPFLYPVHDAPADYQRFTKHKLEMLLAKNGMVVERLISIGQPVVTAAALMNIALVKSVINAIRNKHLFLLFAALLPAVIPIINIFGWLLGKISPADDFMPHSLFVLARKQTEEVE